MNQAELTRKYFDMKNSLRGYGSPEARIWFVGIEDGYAQRNGGAPTTEEMERALTDWESSGKRTVSRVSFDSLQSDVEGGTKIYNYMGYVVGGVDEVDSAPLETLCGKEQNRYFQMNLFPLPRHRHRERWPDMYRSLFKTVGEYEKEISAERFGRLYSFWRDYSKGGQKAVICFGKTCWDHFTTLFHCEPWHTTDAWEAIDLDAKGKILKHVRQRIFLTQFFSAQGAGSVGALKCIVDRLR